VASFDEVVPPGKAGTLHASIHTASYRGPVVKVITVTHDDPSQGPIALNLSLDIVGSVNILPFASVQIAPNTRGLQRPPKVLIRKDATETGTLEVDGIVTSAPWLKATVRKITAEEPAVDGLPAAQPGDVELTVKAENPPVGSRAENLSFKTGLTREPSVTVPVMVVVRAAVILQPSNLILLPAAGPATTATGQVMGAVREDLDPKSLTVVSDSPAFSTHLEPSGERAFRIVVDWNGKGASAPIETTLHVRAGSETTDLPVRVNLARTGATP